MTSGTSGPALLECRDLKRYFSVRRGLLRRPRVLKAVDGVSLAVSPGESLGLVGETGCGKSTTARMLLLLDEPTAGTIFFRGVEVSTRDTRRLAEYRSSVQAVFQDPWGSLNPRMKVRDSIVEPAEISRKMARAETSRLCAELLAAVGLPASAADQFPHEFSGGQRQRIVIARSLSPSPSLIVLDEPVSSLDVSIRAQVLNLLRDLRVERGLSFLLIAHDLATVRYLCDRVAVMYLGRIVEEGPVDVVLKQPAHPYTRALVAASSTAVDPATPRIIGDVASAMDPPRGCHFHPRCPSAFAPCSSVYPGTDDLGPTHYVRCHLYSAAFARTDSLHSGEDPAKHRGSSLLSSGENWGKIPRV